MPNDPVHAFAEDYDVGKSHSAIAVCLHADHFPMGVKKKLLDGRFAQQHNARVADFAAKPFVELRAKDRVTVGPFLIEVLGAVMHADIGRIVHRPQALLNDVALKRCVVPEIRDDLFQRIGIKDRALDVLRTRIFSSLELKDFEACLGHGIRRSVT